MWSIKKCINTINNENADLILLSHNEVSALLLSTSCSIAQKTRVIWDLVPFYFLLEPDWISEESVQTPSENTQRKVFVTKSFEADKMEKDFFSSLHDYFK